ncbi:zinc_finger protein [Hexamita inflata]|uniref:Zinc finger protein n=1 Tax=Hexamita inflata TaxID=28002 RepID=A0AA86RB84_9EUKA|nr:zinc finger protein [Hexamita inflata]
MNGQIFKCKVCKSKFPTKEIMLKHVKKEHPKTIACTICNEECANYDQLQVHLKKVHHQSNQCQKCGQVFKSRQEVVEHVKQAHQEATCRYCSQQFDSYNILQEHLKETHYKNDEGFNGQTESSAPLQSNECLKCGQVFTSHQEVVKHNNQMHKLVFCRFCRQKVASYDMHLKTIHLIEDKQSSETEHDSNNEQDKQFKFKEFTSELALDDQTVISVAKVTNQYKLKQK